MNSKSHLPNELNDPPIINLNIIKNPKKINSTLLPNDISCKSSGKEDNKQIMENKDGTKNITQIKQKEFLDENAPLKNAINEQNSRLLGDLNNFNLNSSLKNLNSGSHKNETASNELNAKLSNNEVNFGPKKSDGNSKKNKSQFVRNTINVLPKEINKFSNQMSGSTLKIELSYKSQIKPKRKTVFTEKISEYNNLDIKNKIKTENKIEINSDINKFNDKEYKYKLLIKKIAKQLKRKNKPATKGYFYVNIIRTDKYLRKIKKIAKKMKMSVFPPTHGFFFNFIQKEKQYKILVKKIASQLKKRIKFPTCKIIKIYESYRILIKRIAESLKISIMNKKEKEEKSNKIILENNSNDNSCILEKNSDIVEESNNSIKIITNENNNLGNDMDIEMENNNDIITSKEENIKNERKDIKYSKLEMMSFSQSNNYEKIDFDLSKKEIIQDGIPNSVKVKKCSDLNLIKLENNDRIETDVIEQIEKVEQNKKDLSLGKIKNDNFSKSDLIQEIDIEQNIIDEIDNNIQIEDLKMDQNNINEEKEELKEVKNIEASPDKSNKIDDDIQTEKIIKNENVNSSNEISNEICDNLIITKDGALKSYPCLSKKNKNIQLFLPAFRKEYFIESNEKKSRSHNMNEIYLNLNKINNNNNYLNNNSNNNGEEVNINEINDKISLSDIEVTDSGFIPKFKKLLAQENIEIIDNFPFSLNNKSITLFHQGNFWYLLINYLFQQNKNISLYSIIHLLEQYNIWSKDNNESLFCSIKETINEYIKTNYSKEIVEQFLFMNKYKDLCQLFDKFEVPKKMYDYKEIKIDNISLINDENNFKCQCDSCTNDRACIQKIMDLNKNRINIVNDTSIYFEKVSPEEYHNICQDNLIQKTNRNIIFHNNEEIFFKNISEKRDNNYYFSKSKTIFMERPNIEYNYIPIKNQYIIANPNNINDDNTKNNVEIINNNITEINIENDNIDDNEDSMVQKYDIVENEEKKKTFKNISKNNEIKETPHNSENTLKKEKEKNDIDLEKKENSEVVGNIVFKEDEDVEEKEKEKDESLDEDNKGKKNEKKNKKAKSRIKNRKKRDFTKMNNEEDNKDLEENKNENEEKVEQGKKGDEKSNKKKKKSGNSTVKKRHKNKFVDKNKDEEKNELEDILKEEKDVIENEKEIDEKDSNSSKKKRSKSKSPNRKKNKKH